MNLVGSGKRRVLLPVLALILAACSAPHAGVARQPQPTSTSQLPVLPSSSITMPVTAPMSACRVGNLSAWETRTQPVSSGGGALWVTLGIENTGVNTCTLPSTLAAASLVNASGQPLHTVFDGNLPSGAPSPRLIELAPHIIVGDQVSWSNWCEGPTGPLSISVTFSGQSLSLVAQPEAGMAVAGSAQNGGALTPSCNDSAVR
jgi:hypothetical protein